MYVDFFNPCFMYINLFNPYNIDIAIPVLCIRKKFREDMLSVISVLWNLNSKNLAQKP